MPTAEEAALYPTMKGSTLQAGVDEVSAYQTVTFTLYRKVVLPLDGWIFWVRSGLLGPSAIYNWSPLNTYTLNEPPRQAPAETIVVKGSFHYSAVQQQQKDESFAINRCIFTALSPVQDFNLIGANELYIGKFSPPKAPNAPPDICNPETPIRFAFSQLGAHYFQAALWHYVGDAVYPVMEDMIIDDVGQLDTQNVIVSNSLPWWLSLQSGFMSKQGIDLPMYPSFLVNDEIDPPYCAVHIPPEATRSLQPLPHIDLNGSHYQLAADKVQLTTYRLRNFNMMDVYDAVLAAIGPDAPTVGFMGANTIVKDEKRTQPELNVLAIKKTIEFEVSYYQNRIREIALQYIKSCIPTFLIREYNGTLLNLS